MLGNATTDSAPLVWPSKLKLLSSGRPLVYLDQNHWISLAKASVGHPHGDQFKEALETCLAATKSGAATFVLGGAHYFEVLKIENRRQRRDVADAMENVTQFQTLLSRATVMKIELGAALDSILGLEPEGPDVEVVGYGANHAFGLPGLRDIFCIRDRVTGEDVTARHREEFGAERFDSILDSHLLEFERWQLRGPKDEAELQKLRSLGFNPEKVLEGTIGRARQEQEQRLRLDGDGPWRRERLPDVVSARELLIEFETMAPSAFHERGVSLEDVATSPQAAVAFMRSMPSTDVAMTLKTGWHRNRDKQWSANDVYDIDSMALSVPYCDIVVSEKGCHHLLMAAGMDRRMNSILLRDLTQLPTAMRNWKAVKGTNGSRG